MYVCIDIGMCICIIYISFARAGEQSCACRQELKGLEYKAGWGGVARRWRLQCLAKQQFYFWCRSHKMVFECEAGLEIPSLCSHPSLNDLSVLSRVAAYLK